MQNTTTRRGLRALTAGGLGTLLAAGSLFGGSLAATAAESGAPAQEAFTGYRTTTPVTVPLQGVMDPETNAFNSSFDMEFDTRLGRLHQTTVTLVTGNEITVDYATDRGGVGIVPFRPMVRTTFDGLGQYSDDWVWGEREEILVTEVPEQRIFTATTSQSIVDESGIGANGESVRFEIRVESGYAVTMPPGVDLTWEMDHALTSDSRAVYSYEYTPYAYTTAPTLSVPTCGEQQTVTPAVSEGVVYDVSRDGHRVVVTAELLAGYEWAPEAETTWSFTLEDEVECPVVSPIAYNLSVSHNEAVAAVDTVLVNVHALDENGRPETDVSDVHVQSTFGEVSAVAMVEPGVFQATLASALPGEATVTFTVDGVDGQQSEHVAFVDSTGAGSGSGELALTGIDASVWQLAAGAGLAAILGAALLVRRRRGVS